MSTKAAIQGYKRSDSEISHDNMIAQIRKDESPAPVVPDGDAIPTAGISEVLGVPIADTNADKIADTDAGNADKIADTPNADKIADMVPKRMADLDWAQTQLTSFYRTAVADLANGGLVDPAVFDGVPQFCSGNKSQPDCKHRADVPGSTPLPASKFTRVGHASDKGGESPYVLRPWCRECAEIAKVPRGTRSGPVKRGTRPRMVAVTSDAINVNVIAEVYPGIDTEALWALIDDAAIRWAADAEARAVREQLEADAVKLAELEQVMAELRARIAAATGEVAEVAEVADDHATDELAYSVFGTDADTVPAVLRARDAIAATATA